MSSLMMLAIRVVAVKIVFRKGRTISSMNEVEP